DRRAQHTGHHLAHQPGGERGGHGSTGEEGTGYPPVDAFAAQPEEDSDRRRNGDDELAGRHRPDHLPQLGPAGDEHRGSGDWTPSASARGVYEAGDQAERGQETGSEPEMLAVSTGPLEREPHEESHAESQEDARHPRPSDL